MKKLIAAIAAIALTSGAFAQSLEEGIKMYNYERYSTARTQLEAQAGSNALANYYVGLSQLGLDDVEGAKATFSKYPEDPANRSGMARVAFVQGNAAEGNKIAGEVANMAKKKVWEPLLYAADAITYTKGGDYQQAVNLYKKASETAPDDARVLIGMGDAFRKMSGGGGQSMSSYEKAVEKNPGNSLGYSKIGSLWYSARNYELALESFNKAKDADPTNPLPYGELADAYYRSGNLKKAKENIEKFRELSDKSQDVERRYLDILYLAGYCEEGLRQAEELMKGSNVGAGVYGEYAYLHLRCGDSVKALDNVRIYFSKQKPEKIGAADYSKYGQILMKNKSLDSAEIYFAKSMEMDTTADRVTNMREIADAFRAAKEFEKSALWYGKLVRSQEKARVTDYFWWGYYNYANGYNLDTAVMAFRLQEENYPDEVTGPYWRGRTAAAIDSNAKTGLAAPHYEKWLSYMQPDWYSKKKNDLSNAYQYLITYYYNSNDKANLKKYLDEMEKLDPENSFVKQMKELEKSMKS
ncbi:MAG: tetratricopeptide repeat protein [Flavipsychrobacter sp.]|nr:tetratricopeptide repeat protein [Flavipsychrobacter sp.]